MAASVPPNDAQQPLVSQAGPVFVGPVQPGISKLARQLAKYCDLVLGLVRIVHGRPMGFLRQQADQIYLFVHR